MNRRQFLALSGAALVLAGLPQMAQAADVKAEFAALDPVVGKAMNAYNAKDSAKFYADWANQVKTIATPQAFKTLYVDVYHKKYGALKSRKLVDARSVMSDMNGLFVYEAQFAKGKGFLNVNFFKEGGKWKIQQIQVTDQ